MSRKIDHNSYWQIDENPISRTGIFPYLGRQISPVLEPDRVYNVLRPEEELFSQATMDSFKLKPLVNDHCMLGEDFTPAEKHGIHGVLGERIRRKGDFLVANMEIYSETLKNEIRNGKKELSLGYFCDYDITPGTYKGIHYDAVQRNLRGNHIALVDRGRMGHDVRVMDGMRANDAKDVLVYDEMPFVEGLTGDSKDPDFKDEEHPRDENHQKFVKAGSSGTAESKKKEEETENKNENAESESGQIKTEQEQIKEGYEETKNNPDKGTKTGMHDVLTTMHANLKTYLIHRGATTRNENGEIVVRGRRLLRDRGTSRNFGFSKMIFGKGLTVEEMCQLPLFIRDYEPVTETETGKIEWIIPNGKDFPFAIAFTKIQEKEDIYFLVHMSKDPRSAGMEKSKKKKASDSQFPAVIQGKGYANASPIETSGQKPS